MASIAASVTPRASSQAASCCSGRQNVRNTLTVAVYPAGAAAGVSTVTVTCLLCTSMPATAGWMISMVPPAPESDTGHGRAARGARNKIEIL